MAVDVIIDPSSGQIYWNDAAGSGTQTIAISGNATNAINIVGYSNFFSPGGGGIGTQILATFNDSATSTFVPGTNAYDLGSSALRWNFYGTAGNFTGVISTSSSTASTNTTTGALTVAGGLGVQGDVYVASNSGSKLSVMQSSGDEGGEIFLNKAVTNTTIVGGVTIDVYQNRLRFFEQGGSARGFYLDITTGGNGAATNLAAGGSTGISSLNGLTASTQTFATGTSGTDFNISSATSTHTFNIPYAGAASTGLITTQTQTIAGAKTFSGNTSVTSSTAATSTSTGALVVTGGVGIGGSLWTSSSNISSVSGVTLNNGTITGTLSGTATSAQVIASTTDTTSTLYFLGTRSNAGFAGTAIYVDTGISALGNTMTATTFSGTATSAALVNTDVSTATRYLVGTVLNTASGSTQLSTGSGITIGNNTITATTFVGSLTGTASIASSSVTSATTTDTTSTLYFLGTRSNGGFAGTAIYVDTGISALGNTITATTFSGNATTATNSANTNVTLDTTSTIYLTGSRSNASIGSTPVYVLSGVSALGNTITATTFSGNATTATNSANTNVTLDTTSTIYLTGSRSNASIGSTPVYVLSGVSALGNTITATTFSGALTGTASIATSSVTSATTTDTSSTLYLLGSRSSTGFAGTAIYVDTNISIAGFQITAGVWAGTAISAVNGGTGQVSYTIGDILYASSTTALSKLSAGTAGSVLTSNGAGAAPSYKAVTSSATPAGSSSWLQYNNSGSFGATSYLAYNGNGNNDFVISTPFSTSTQGQVNIGLGITGFDGVTLGKFAGSASGTVIAINQASGFAGNFADFQLAGSSKFTIGPDGKITVVGVYSLPTTAGTAGSVLTSNGTGGQFYWSAPSSGGGAGTVASGTANQVAYYAATGASVSGAANLTYNTTSVTVANTTASNNNSSGALLVYGGIGASGQISGAGASFTSTVFLNGIRIGQGGNNITFTDAAAATIGDFNTSNGWFRSAQTTQSTSSSTGALVSSGGLGVAKAASIGETIYALSTVASTGWSTGGLISSGGLGVSKASYFNGDLFVTSATNSTSLSTGAVVISGGVGIGKTMFVGDNINIFKSGSVGALRLWNSANTFYTGLQAGNPSANTTYTLPITFPGTAGSTLISDTSGVMSWAAPGGTGTVTTLTSGLGVSFSSGATITTTGTIRARRPVTIIFCAGFTPAATGVDSVVIKVPDNQNTGASDRIFNCIEASVRVETASGTASTIRIEKYGYAGGTGVSAFSTSSTGSTTNIFSGIGLTIGGATTYEFATTSFAAGHGTCGSGDKLRLNFTQLSATHANFSVRLVLEEQ